MKTHLYPRRHWLRPATWRSLALLLLGLGLLVGAAPPVEGAVVTSKP